MTKDKNYNTQATFSMEAQYIKDLSFENPKAPMSLGALKSEPKIDLNFGINASKMGDNLFEVSLTLQADAVSGEDKLFMIELIYCGLFRVGEMTKEQEEYTIFVHVPYLLFPYMRRIIADVSRDGGFVPMMLDPIDFNAMYLQKKTETSTAN